MWQSLGFSSAADSAAGTEVDESLLQSISLRAQEVNAWGLSLASTQLQGNYHHQHWQFRVESPVLKGDIQWHDDRPLAAQLDYLNLPATEAAVSVEDEHTEQEAVPEQPPVDIWQEVDPAELPEFDLFVAKLQQGEQSYGRWQLQSRQQPQGLQLEITESDLFGLGITGLVTWHKEQGVHHTELHELQIKGSRIERLQQGFGFSPLISSNAVSGQLSAQWPGSPLGYQLQDIEAELSLSLKDGRVAADGASAVKAFGVLNVNSLSRRLKLDFSDLYKSGLAFDRFSTKLNAAEGVVTLTEPINLEGPSGKFITTGTTNLLDQSLDMRVAVVLPVSTNLPLVAILAGLSPPVAASIYVTEKLVGDELSRFTTANYDLKGTWQEPEMTMRSAFNQEGSENRGFFKRLFGR